MLTPLAASDASYQYMDVHVDVDPPDMPIDTFAASFLLPKEKLNGLTNKPMSWWLKHPSATVVSWEYFEMRMLYVVATKWMVEASTHGSYQFATANGLLQIMQTLEAVQIDKCMTTVKLTTKFQKKLKSDEPVVDVKWGEKDTD